LNDPWRNLDSILVAVDQEKIVSTVRIFHRNVYFNGQVVSMGGIGEVSTKPEYRCKGLSTMLLTMAIKRMESVGIKVSTLGAAQEKIGYYNKLGWESMSRCFNVSTVKGNDNLSFKIRPVNFETDIPRINLIHSIYSGKLNGVVVRDEEYYWNKWVKNEAKNFYVVEDENDTAIAYIDFDKYDKTLRIREFGELLGQESIFSSLVAEVIKLVGADECEVVYSTAIQSQFKVNRIIEEKNEMIRLINPFQYGDINIETTKQFVKVMNINAEREKSQGFIFWDTDSF
jgi:predicted acetyltransferase